jgi:hypothetical protein
LAALKPTIPILLQRSSGWLRCKLSSPSPFAPRAQSSYRQLKMPPKKKVERPATENISLGPQVREGAHVQKPSKFALANSFSQVKWCLASLVSSLPSTIPSSMSPISGSSHKQRWTHLLSSNSPGPSRLGTKWFTG